MNVFEFNDYKELVRTWIAQRPKDGRGEYQRISEHIRVHRTTISQIFSGSKQLTTEQGAALAEHMGLAEREAQYFILLVEKDRAGTPLLKEKLTSLLKGFRENPPKLVRLKEKELEERLKATFYSDWIYSAIRVVASLRNANLGTPSDIARRLDIEISTAAPAIEFLLDHDLLRKNRNDRYEPAQRKTYLPPNSPFIHAHRRAWHGKALERTHRLGNDEILFSCPISLSREAYKKLGAEMNALIKRAYELAGESDVVDEAAILNLDLVRL